MEERQLKKATHHHGVEKPVLFVGKLLSLV